MTKVCKPEYPEHHPHPSVMLRLRSAAMGETAAFDDGDKVAGFVGNPSPCDQAMLATIRDDMELCV